MISLTSIQVWRAEVIGRVGLPLQLSLSDNERKQAHVMNITDASRDESDDNVTNGRLLSVPQTSCLKLFFGDKNLSFYLFLRGRRMDLPM